MSFGESVSICFAKYADFNGRASRPEYWWFFLLCVLGNIATGIIHDMFSNLFALATLLPSLAVGARRLHDTDRSGWFLLLGLIPVIGWIALIVLLAQEAKEPNRFSAPATNG